MSAGRFLTLKLKRTAVCCGSNDDAVVLKTKFDAEDDDKAHFLVLSSGIFKSLSSRIKVDDDDDDDDVEEEEATRLGTRSREVGVLSCC